MSLNKFNSSYAQSELSDVEESFDGEEYDDFGIEIDDVHSQPSTQDNILDPPTQLEVKPEVLSSTPELIKKRKTPHWLTEELAADFSSKLDIWRGGDPMLELVPEQGRLSKLPPNTKELDHLNPDRRKKIESFLEKLGSTGRNRLATPMEYLSIGKLVSKHLMELLGDLPQEDLFVHVFPEFQLEEDPSSAINSEVGDFYMVFYGAQYPNETTWKTTFKIEQHMAKVTKMASSFYILPMHSGLNGAIPPDMLLSNILLPDGKYGQQAFELARYYGFKDEEDIASFSLKDFDMKNRLAESRFWNETFLAYLDKNGKDHLVFSDEYDYSIGHPEVLKQKVRFENKTGLSQYFKLASSDYVISDLNSSENTHSGLPAPHYAMDRYNKRGPINLDLEEVKTEKGNVAKVEEGEKKVKPKRRAGEGLWINFGQPIEKDITVSKKLSHLTHLAYSDRNLALVNSKKLFELMGTDRMRALHPKMDKILKEEGVIGSDESLSNMSGAKIIPLTNRFLTVWRISLHMICTNYHFFDYKTSPIVHPFEEEIQRAIIREKRKGDCLPKLTPGKYFIKPTFCDAIGYSLLMALQLPPRALSKISLLLIALFDLDGSDKVPLISLEEEQELAELGIRVDVDLIPRKSKNLGEVLTTVKNQKYPHWDNMLEAIANVNKENVKKFAINHSLLDTTEDNVQNQKVIPHSVGFRLAPVKKPPPSRKNPKKQPTSGKITKPNPKAKRKKVEPKTRPTNLIEKYCQKSEEFRNSLFNPVKSEHNEQQGQLNKIKIEPKPTTNKRVRQKTTPVALYTKSNKTTPPSTNRQTITTTTTTQSGFKSEWNREITALLSSIGLGKKL